MLDKKCLYLSWAIPPSQGGSSYITYELSKHLDSKHFIVVGSKYLFQGSGKLLKNINSVKVYHLPTEINILGHGYRYFEWLRNLFYRIILNRLIKIAKKEKITDIIVTFPEEYYFKLGCDCAKFCDLTLHLYFHNTYSEQGNPWINNKAIKIQADAFEMAKNIFTMSDGLNRYYKKQYPEIQEKFVSLPHTFSEYKQIVNVLSHEPIFKFVFIGTINQSNLDSTKRLFEELGRMKDVELHIYTPVNKLILIHKWKLDINKSNFYIHEPVSQDLVHSELQKYNACILTHGFGGEYSSIEYDTIFPTRLIPLLISGRPIFAHTPLNCFVTSFIKDNDCCEMVNTKDLEILKQALYSFINDKERQNILVTNALDASRQFYGPNVVKKLVSYL